jgi:hypothetical protein
LRTFLLVIFVVAGLRVLYGNPPAGQRNYHIPASERALQLDTLSIIGESFSIYGPDGLPLDPAFYSIDYLSTRLQLRVPDYWLTDSLRVEYRVWPINLTAPVFLRDTSLIRLPGPGEDHPRVIVGPTPTPQGLVGYDGLQSSGSITRGLTMGNRQDPVLNSAMNLQLNGLLTDDISIMAVISDQNIPFQPDGSTQQLQDFDKVFIRLQGGGVDLTAGDFELEKPPGHFMHVNRKARGAMVEYRSGQSDTTIVAGGRLRTVAAGAISRGKYARNPIQGQEGNQGPYRLRGNDNESYILIMAGTERVFIDGRPLQRGMDRDYVIDYNSAEITFMPLIMITRESRIVVEFEYAERNFARSMIHTGAELELKRAAFRFNYFNEQDHRNQPLFQELSGERRELMAQVGDSVHRAFALNVDSSGFRNDRVMYRMVDTLGYEQVFVYSTDPGQAHYQPGFSFVGNGNGNYLQVNSTANGRVYQWMAPVDGNMQGTHEPVIQLVTPKKHQMVTLGGDLRLSASTGFRYEYALSNRDINLYSDRDKGDDMGHAVKVELMDQRGPGSSGVGWKVASKVSYEFTEALFRPLERFREVEFERNWNIDPSLVVSGNEQLYGISVQVENPAMGQAGYSLAAFSRGDQYLGLMNNINSRLRVGKNHFFYNGSLLNTSGLRQSNFYRHRTLLQRDFKHLKAGVEHQTENNRILAASVDSLSRNSVYFSQWEFFLSQPDASPNEYRLFYRMREDRLPGGRKFIDASMARDYGIQYRLLEKADQRIGIQVLYRELDVLLERFPGEKSDQSINARGDYFSRWGRGVVTSSIFYETSSGRERKREYMFIEVPAGQGAYIWNDYNGNGIMELDEFELTPYPDEANFIRVFIPTEEFVPVFATVISHSLNFEPAVVWRDHEGFRKWVSRFSNRLNYRIDNKKQGSLQPANFNPFFTDIDDSLLISLSSVVRNSLFFNRSHPRYNLEWTFQDNRNKNLLSNGFESRAMHSNTLRSRLNISRQISMSGLGEWGERIAESEFFVSRNYRIQFYNIEPSLNFQPVPNTRFALVYGLNRQINTMGDQESLIHRVTLENRVSFPSRGTLQVRYQVSRINFGYDPNTPVAFEMLQGLRHGTNHLWNINWQQNLNAFLQLSLQYNGRKPPGVPAVHTGSVQLRALF